MNPDNLIPIKKKNDSRKVHLASVGANTMYKYVIERWGWGEEEAELFEHYEEGWELETRVLRRIA